jgi:eukaryotic-like serine/threonine-protein kinase
MDAAARSDVPGFGTLVAGRYRIAQVIGEGGMGVVLAARDEDTGQEVALKLLQMLGAANTERFLREARLITRIESEHVVRVLDTGALDGHPFLVMERLRGEDFGAKIRGGRLPLVEVADCIVQTCEALAHAHGAGVVHRDIKASNLFEHESADGRRTVKVLDFGISKSLSRSENEGERTLTRTRDGGFLGSPPYMSPEHIRDPRNVDGRADLWSLGVVAYRLLSTAYPFDGESTGEVLVAILEKRPARFRDLGVDVPEEVERIILKCLERKRDDRWSNAGELAAAFAPFASPHLRGYGAKVHAIVRQKGAPRSTGRLAEPSTRTVPPPVRPAADDPSTRTASPPYTDDPTTTPSNPAAFAEVDASSVGPADDRGALPKLAGDPMPSVTKLLVTSPVRPTHQPPSPSTGPTPSPTGPIDLPIVSPRRPRRLPVLAGGFLGAIAIGALLTVSAWRMRTSVTTTTATATPSATDTTSTDPPSSPGSAMIGSAAPPPPAPLPVPPSAATAPPPSPPAGKSGRPRPGRPPRPNAPATPTTSPEPKPPPTPTKKPELQPNPYPDL